MPLTRQAAVTQSERDKYKAALGAGAVGMTAGTLAQHHLVHNVGRRIERPESKAGKEAAAAGAKYHKPIPWQFRSLLNPSSKSHLKGSTRGKAAAGWTGAMLLNRAATPLAAGGAIGLATTRQRKGSQPKGSLSERLRAGLENARASTKEEQPELSQRESRTMAAGTFGGGLAGAMAHGLSADALLRRKKNAEKLAALRSGAKLPGKGRALAAMTATATGSAIGLRAAGKHVESNRPGYQMTPFGLRRKETRAVGKGGPMLRMPDAEIVAKYVTPGVPVVLAPKKERQAEAHRKRVQAGLSTAAAVGTLTGLGMRGAGALVPKSARITRKLGAKRAARLSHNLSERALDVSLATGGVGAASSLYFGRQQRREAKALDKGLSKAFTVPKVSLPRTGLPRLAGAGPRSGYVARRRLPSGLTRTYSVRGSTR